MNSTTEEIIYEIENLECRLQELIEKMDNLKSERVHLKLYKSKINVVEAMQYSGNATSIKCWLEARDHIKCEIKDGGLHTYLIITNSNSGRKSGVQAGNYVVFDGANVFIYDKHAFKEIFEEIV